MAERFKACLVDGCNGNAAKPGSGRGWCTKHYQRWQKHGDPLKSKINREQTGKPCTVDGCDKPSGYRGMCQMHFKRLQTRGSVSDDALHPKHKRRIKWLEAHKDYAGDGCLKWPFGVNETGRGVATINGVNATAPNIMCTLAHGPAPTPDHEAAHSCGKGHEGCVHPAHLRWATRAENRADMIVHGTIRRGELVNTNKLSVSQVRQIRAVEGSMHRKDTAKMFGVSYWTVWEIQTRRSWAWLP